MDEEQSILLKIGNEADRVTVASILFKNGYTVSTARMKRNGKTYEYYVSCKKTSPDVDGGSDSGS